MVVKLFNNIPLTGNVPKEFNKAEVIGVFKPAKPCENPANVRPISILSICYKLAGKNCGDQVLGFVTYIRLKWHLCI